MNGRRWFVTLQRLGGGVAQKLLVWPQNRHGLQSGVHQPHLETCRKCKFLGLSPDLISQKLVSPPGDSHTCSSWRNSEMNQRRLNGGGAVSSYTFPIREKIRVQSFAQI